MRKSILLPLLFLVGLLPGCRKFATYSFQVNPGLKVPVPSLEQIRPDTLDFPYYQSALAHAPILWYADREEHFPTLPFFPAFDGIDNNGNGRIDFGDPSEVAPLAENSPHSIASLDSLHQWYCTLPRDERRKLAVVFYKVDSLPADKVGKILFSDEQAWMRLNRDIKSYLKNEEKSLLVFQYFFYFVHDQGLKGHPEDLEHAFIFVPRDTFEFFGIAAGAGHWDIVPNSILIYQRGELPPSDGFHLHLLAELGGHSQAPDLNGNGVFEPGVDVNWHTEHFWGTRDIQAISGQGSTSKYQTWMTFQRSDSSLIYPPDAALLKNKPASAVYYRLLPVEKFRSLENSILSSSSQAKEGSSSNWSSGVEKHFGFLNQAGFSLPESFDSPETIRRLRLWSQDKRVRISDQPEYVNWSKDKHKVWKMRAYNNSTTEIFRNYLFRPRRYGGLGLWGKLEQSTSPEFRLAWITPAWAWRIVPMKVDGVTEFHFGWQAPSPNRGFKREKLTAAFYYDRFYARLISWYTNLTYLNSSSPFSNFSLGGGASFQLPALSLVSVNPLDTFHWVRLRVGIRVPLDKNALRFDATHLELQLGIHY
ncbi:MAG: hypothetical protein A2142_09745 [candidate division Zixibacteria bacterium RBG_16_48_11]|nr:MAG: hypothetical protein A2142_09745 [candidate division Zixibacteria bacterium RBG_16_48_11]